MTALTPWGGAGSAEAENDPLVALTTTAVNEHQAISRRLRTLPTLAGLAGAQPAVDVVAASLVLVTVLRAPGMAIGPITAVALGLVWLTALGLSDAWRLGVGGSSAAAILRATMLTGVVCWIADALLQPAATTSQLLTSVVALALTASAARLPAALGSGARTATRVAVAGDGADVRRVVAELRRHHRRRWEITSVCLDADDPQSVDRDLAGPAPVWIGAGKVVEAARATGATAVLIAPGRALCPEAARRLTWSAQQAGLDVLVDTGLDDVAPRRARMVTAGTLDLVDVRASARTSPSRLVKHVTDRIGAAVLLVLMLPVLVGVAVLVRLESPGPALFRQRRAGRDGSTFTMYKFRTMTVGAEALVDDLATANESDDVLFKIREDPRVTRVGRILRRYSADELPQLINVLRGEMSLVGPRPALPSEVAQYDEDPQRRLAVKPGMTGLWQVSGRSDLTWEESVRLDLHYVDNWSLGLDLVIMARTFAAVTGHRGAY